MDNTFNSEKEYMLRLQESIRRGLSAVDEKSNWLELYDSWKNEEANQFVSLLKVQDSFNTKCAGDSYSFNTANLGHMVDLDVFKMSVFLSEHLMRVSRLVFAKVRAERNRNKMIILIEEYFEMVDGIAHSMELSGCVVTLNDAAEKQMVLQGNRAVDLYVCFYSLRELLRKETTESLYLLYTLWRITKTKKNLKLLINAIIDYIKVYFDDFDNDPQMHLHYPVEGLMIAKKLDIISHWFEIIAFHTNGLFEKYKEFKWMTPIDSMADDIVETAQISRYEMLQYKCAFGDDDNETVKKKAICFHSYSIWIKTVDVMHIFCDVCHSIYYLPDEQLKKMNTSKAAMLELYDNMTKIRNYYTGRVFFHQVYYELERKYLDSQVMEALESDAELLSESVEDVIDFVDAISSQDIENLMQAKAKYMLRLKEFTTEEQEKKLDDLTVQIVEKIKSTISKEDVYDKLYASISTEFEPFLSILAKFPNIFSSLVSAEYLYHQYVEGKSPIENFDYSCISIMYYMALEDFVNKLFYTPYSNNVLSSVAKEDWKKYVTHNISFWDQKNKRYKKSCEIGNLGYLLKGIKNCEFLQSYVTTVFPNADLEKVMAYGKKLIDIAPRRNEAAHGGNYLLYSDVCIDKSNVFNSSINDYKGLILELFEIVF